MAYFLEYGAKVEKLLCIKKIIPAFVFWKTRGHHIFFSRFTDLYHALIINGDTYNPISTNRAFIFT